MQLLNTKNKNAMIIISVAASIALIFLDQSSIGVILQQIQTDLEASDLGIRWIVNAYILTLSVLVLFGGQVTDFFGAKKIFIFGMSLFCVASFFCVISTTVWFLITARVIQGLGASLLIPSALVLINIGFSENERGKVLGTCVGIGSLFFASGPVFGGVVTQLLSWRWIFLLNIPLGLVSIVCASLITSQRLDKSNKLKEIDFAGLLIFIMSIFSVVVALMEGPYLGWKNKWIIILFVISFLGSILFYLVEIKNSNPLIHFELFKSKNFFAGNLILFNMQVCVVSIIYLVLWFEKVMKYSPLITGIAILPGFVPAIILSKWAGSWLDKRGSRAMLCIGTFLVSLGVMWISLIAYTHNYYLVFLGILSYGLGAAITIPNSATIIMASVEPWRKGMAAGILNTMRQLGGAIGLAVIGLVISNFLLKNNDTAYTQAFSFGMFTAGIFGFASTYLAYRYLENK